MTPEDPICPICKNPKRVSGSGSLTQWLVACSCDLVEIEESQRIPIHICNTCGKRIDTGRAGSMTQFIFRSDSCRCEMPTYRQPEVSEKDETFKEEFDIEEENEIEFDPKYFPLERYKPLKQLGSGSGGLVYLARDKLLDKKVAIKILHMLTDLQLIAFQQEARSTSRLSHPVIIDVLDFGATESGIPYMVMEYVIGSTLKQKIENEGRLNWQRASELLVIIADALSYAHGRGIFHRDTTPSNIILLDETKDLVDIKLIDFGVAKTVDENSSSDTIVGTPFYMSPDQANGLQYDARSEVYSLGCVLFEMLTGEVPYEGETAIDTIAQHASKPIPNILELNSNIPPEFDGVIKKALAKKTDERFQTIREFADAINEIEPIEIAKIEKKDHVIVLDKVNSRLIYTIIALVCIGITVAAYITWTTQNHKVAERAKLVSDKIELNNAERRNKTHK